MFESIISRPTPPPSAPFVFTSTLVERKKVPLKASTVLNKAAPSVGTSSTNSTKSTKTPSLGTQRKSSSKLSPQQNKTSSKPPPNKPITLVCWSKPPQASLNLGRVNIILFIGMNIVFWNCQGLRPKQKELQNYLLENQIDILALKETFLKPKIKFHLPGYEKQK